MNSKTSIHDMEPSTKTGILNRTLPENLRFINVFQYNHDCNKLCEYVKNVIPDIVFSNLKKSLKSEESTKQIFLTTTDSSINKKHFSSKRKRTYRNGKCYLCNKFWHYAKEYRKFNKPVRFNLTKNKKFKSQLKNSNKYHNHSIIKQGYKHKSYEQLNSLENNINDTNNNNSLSKDYNTENYSFLGCVIKNNSSSQVTNEITSSSHNDLIAWILDSGSSLHLINSLKYLTNLC